MSSAETLQFALALSTTVVLGGTLLWMTFRFLAKNAGVRQLQEQHESAREESTADLKLGQGIGGEEEPVTKEKSTARSGRSKLPTKIPRPKRNIPAAAAKEMIARGHRLREEENYTEALKCYLALLFAAVEEGGRGDLPRYLTDCLRGAAECYKGMNEYQHAVEFLQAERMIYEEMVAQEHKLKKNMEGSTNVLKALFDGKGPRSEQEVPHRCEVLNGVAEVSLKHGYNDLGLSYRVKAAALRHKIDGTPLDPDSPEAIALAEALDACQEGHAEEARDEPADNDRHPRVPGPKTPPPEATIQDTSSHEAPAEPKEGKEE